MPDTAAATTFPTKNPFETARRKLIAALSAMTAPAAYPAYPSPSDHEAIADHIREAAQIFDDWLAAVGSEVRDNAVTAIDRHMFSGSFTGAIDGNETYACTEQGEALREYSEQRRSMRRAS